MFHFFRFFVRHCAWALAVFCLFSIALEWLIPDSVTPYLHIVPLVIVAMLFLSADAMMTHEASSMIGRVISILALFGLAGTMFFSYSGSGKADGSALLVIFLLLVGSTVGVLTLSRD